MAFFKPFYTTIEEIPVIVYPCTDIVSNLDRKKANVIEEHLSELYIRNKSNFKTLGQYNIDIIWIDGKDLMTDVWIFDKIESWGSGPLADVKVFRNFDIEANIGVSAGDGLILLGNEESHRRTKKTLDEYIMGDRPELSSGLNPTEDFYL